MYETGAVFLDSRESMEVLDEVLAGFHHSLSLFPLPEEVSMLGHSIEYLGESWFVVSRQETPRIPKARTTDHKTVEVFMCLSFLRRQESSGI